MEKAKTTAQSASAALALFGMAFNAEAVVSTSPGWDGEPSDGRYGRYQNMYCNQNQMIKHINNRNRPADKAAATTRGLRKLAKWETVLVSSWHLQSLKGNAKMLEPSTSN